MRISDWSSDVCSSDLFERFAVERLHHIFVGARLDRGADMVDAVFGGAEDDARPFLMPIVEIVERAEKLHAAHHRHVPVKQDDVGTIDAAEGQRLLSIGRILDGKGHAFKDMARDLDRKSVVQGKRVSVSVDHGGRRIIKKKKKKKQ